jgi:hypothetical protein
MKRFPKTTLILGAGASHPYGYPIGQGLISDIVRACDEVTPTSGFAESHVNNFRQDLLKSGCRSIDSFLVTRNDYHDLAKYLICKILLKLENENRVFHVSLLGDQNIWYNNFFEELKLEDFESLKIVTFNYDRSLEYFLNEKIRAKYNMSVAEAAKAVKKIEIHHVHGRLPHLPGEKDGENGIPYGFYGRPNDFNNASLKSFASNLKTAFEARDATDRYYKIVSESERVIFLGFGFIKENMITLGLDENFTCTSENVYYATLFGANFTHVRSIYDNYPKIKIFNKTCNSIFKDVVEVTSKDYRAEWEEAQVNLSFWPQ